MARRPTAPAHGPHEPSPPPFLRSQGPCPPHGLPHEVPAKSALGPAPPDASAPKGARVGPPSPEACGLGCGLGLGAGPDARQPRVSGQEEGRQGRQAAARRKPKSDAEAEAGLPA